MTDCNEAGRPAQPAARITLVAHLCVLVGFALAAGLVEAVVLLIRRYVGGEFIWTGLDVVWMAPVSYLVFLLIPAAVLALAARRWPGRNALAATVFVAAVVTVGSLLTLALGGRLHPIAIGLLASGVAIQAARWARAHSSGAVRLARRTAPALAGVVVFLGAGFGAERYATERQRLRELPTPAVDAPNVVLLILDTVRAASLSLYGYPRPTTPLLAARAAHGVVFEWAIAPAPWTLPSHASMFTGRYPHQLTTGWLTPLDDRTPTVAEAFRRAGYLTAAFTANFYYTTRETGLSRGFDHFQSRIVTPRQILLGSTIGQEFEEERLDYGVDERLSDRRSAEEINRAAFEWLDGRDATRPFFLFANYFDAHRPVHAPAPFRARFAGEEPVRDEYDASIAYLDTQVEALLAGLEARGLLRNTVVVVTSDHGELLGEHDLRGHGNSLYMPLLHVPLVILAPGVPRGARVAQPVGLQDLAATLIQMAGVRSRQAFPGASLARFWDPTARTAGARPVIASVMPGINAPARQPASHGPMYSITVGRLQYIRGGDGREELYDLTRDPLGMRDVGRTSWGRARLPELRRALDAAMTAAAPLPGKRAARVGGPGAG